MKQGYAKLLAHGFDTIQETAFIHWTDQQWGRFEEAQAEARESNRDEGVPFTLGDERMMMRPHGAKGGVRFVLANDDFLLLIRSRKVDYGLTVRYLAAGLWEHGWLALSSRVAAIFASQVDWTQARIGRADYAFDFHSPAFTSEFKAGLAGQVVAHSSCKAREHIKATTYSRAAQGETLTIGTKSGLQVEVYNKTLEITEASGKTWMYELWAEAAEGEVMDRDVWRVEVRMGKEYLRDRAILDMGTFFSQKEKLIGEALIARRLTVPLRNDSNRRRWPTHPLWSAAFEVAGADEMRPLGRLLTDRRSKLIKAQRKQIAGSLRALAVLTYGSADEGDLSKIIAELPGLALADEEHLTKTEMLRARYADVDEAR